MSQPVLKNIRVWLRKNVRGSHAFNALVGLGLLAYYYFKEYLPKKRLEENHKYTVARVYDISKLSSDEPEIVYYSYKVNQVSYYSSFYYHDSSRVRYNSGAKIFLKFCTEDPNICEELLNPRVPDTLEIAPQQGWYRIPVK